METGYTCSGGTIGAAASKDESKGEGMLASNEAGGFQLPLALCCFFS